MSGMNMKKAFYYGFYLSVPNLGAIQFCDYHCISNETNKTGYLILNYSESLL